MKAIFVASLFWLALSTYSHALDITTRSGRRYHDCRAPEIRVDGLRIVHSTGIETINWRDLPATLQRQYHYDAAKGRHNPKLAAQEAYEACQRAYMEAQQAEEQQLAALRQAEADRNAAEERRKSTEVLQAQADADAKVRAEFEFQRRDRELREREQAIQARVAALVEEADVPREPGIAVKDDGLASNHQISDGMIPESPKELPSDSPSPAATSYPSSRLARAMAQDSDTSAQRRILSYEEVLASWDRSRSYGDPRDFKSFATDLETLHPYQGYGAAAQQDGAWIRFYARCEEILGDGTGLILVGALVAALFAAHRFLLPHIHRMLATASQGHVSATNADSSLFGVRGWLLFLCIWTTILWPLFTFAKLHKMSEIWMYLFLGIIIFAIVSGVTLWRASPVGLILVRTFLIIILFLNLFSIFTSGSAHPELVPLTLFQSAIPAAWLIYLHHSKRVRITYRQ